MHALNHDMRVPQPSLLRRRGRMLYVQLAKAQPLLAVIQQLGRLGRQTYVLCSLKERSCVEFDIHQHLNAFSC